MPVDAARRGSEKPTRVMLVSPGPELTAALANRLRRHGFDVHECFSCEEALRRHGEFDLILFDLPLSEVDLLDICRWLKTHSDVPVVALVEAGAGSDQTLRLQAWSDHCLIKPYRFRELQARIEAVLRRSGPRPTMSENAPDRPVRHAHQIQHGALLITPDTRQVSVSGSSVDLTRKEFDLLYRLASEPHAVLSRAQLLSEVWGYHWPAEPFGPRATRTVDTHVSALRAKLGHYDWIITVRGVGFRIGDATQALSSPGRLS